MPLLQVFFFSHLITAPPYLSPKSRESSHSPVSAFQAEQKSHKSTVRMTDQKQSPCRILVMASGNGSNFQALINAVASGVIPNSKIVRLIVNRSKAYATTRADQAGIYISHLFFHHIKQITSI